MLKLPKLPPLTAKFLHLLRREGVEPTDQEVAWLYDVGKLAVRGTPPSARNMAGFPACAGSVPLYPLCRGAETWVLEYAAPWWMEGQKHPRYERLAMLYAHAHSVPGQDVSAVFLQLTERDRAREAIVKWALTLNCTNEQEWAALEAVEDAEDALAFAPDSDDDEPLAGVDDETWLGASAARVAARSGCSVWELIWTMPSEAVKAVEKEIADEMHRDACMTAGEYVPNPNSSESRALDACLEICRRIKKRVAEAEDVA